MTERQAMEFLPNFQMSTSREWFIKCDLLNDEQKTAELFDRVEAEMKAAMEQTNPLEKLGVDIGGRRL